MRRALRAVAVALVLSVAVGASPRVDSRPPTRLVVVKYDGLPPALVDRFVRRTDPRTGRSVLPWIERLFYTSGVRFDDFTSRGASLSEPSWTILDTGQHGVIKGNFEVDRNTGNVQYYLDFVSFYADAARFRRVYPVSVETLDASGTPLLSDAFRANERETGIQLNRRGTKFNDFLRVGLGPVKGPVKERLGDLLVGVDFHRAYDDATREAFLKAVRDPAIRYADIYYANVDEVIHDDNSETGILEAVRRADRLLGETYAAIEASGAADRTVLAVVSDHGLTFDLNGRYSQGVNLVAYLAKPELGANTVLAHDAPRANYSLKRSIFKPWLETAVVQPAERPYVANRPERVTCAIDYDGNERAMLQLRDPDLNRLELLVGALREGSLDAPKRAAASAAVMRIVERHRAAWIADAARLREEIGALARVGTAAAADAKRLHELVEAHRRDKDGAPDGRPPLPPFGGLAGNNESDRWEDLAQSEKEKRAEAWRSENYAEQYRAVAASLERRAAARSASDLVDAPVEDVFGAFDLGDRPSTADLLDYPAGLAGVALDASGDLDESATFVHVDYLRKLSEIRVRNAVRTDTTTAPVAYTTTRLPVDATVKTAVARGVLSADDAARVGSAYLVYGDDDDQIVLFVAGARDASGPVRAVPVSRFAADAVTGEVTFESASWRAGLPFGLFEDDALATGDVDRTAWLSAFHTDREWLAATSRTASGLGVPNLVEVLSCDYREGYAAAAKRDATDDERLVRRFELRRRDAAMGDIFLEAAPHWNFDVKDFNPGGNHGGFGRQSMHAVFWMHGGPETRVVPGPLVVAAPYDGLDFAPTVFEAAGVTTNGALPVELISGGFRAFPGRVATEALKARE